MSGTNRSSSRRILLATAGVLVTTLVAGCQTTAERECETRGHEAGTPAFRECVADRRLEGAVEMKRQAGGNLGRQR